MSTVSFLIPVYNGEAWLDGAIRSAVNQTRSPDEVLVVDDGSTDLTARIATVWASRDPRVRLLQLPENVGAAAARNAGLARLHTTWVALLDADDEALPCRLKQQLAFAGRWPHAAAVGGIAEYMTADGRSTGRYTEVLPLTTPADLAGFLSSGRIIALNNPSSMLHRARVLACGGYRSQHDGAEDVDLWNRLVDCGHCVLQQHDVVTRYRVHPASMVSAKAGHVWQTAAWTTACIEARRAGRPEPTREEFYRERNRTMAHRLDFDRRIRGQIMWRAAATGWVNGARMRSIGQGLLALVLRPRLTLSRLWSKWWSERPLRDSYRVRIKDCTLSNNNIGAFPLSWESGLEPRSAGDEDHGDESWDARTKIPAPYAGEAEWRRAQPEAAVVYDFKTAHGG